MKSPFDNKILNYAILIALFATFLIGIIAEIITIFSSGALMGADSYYFRFVIELLLATGNKPSTLPNTTSSTSISYESTFEHVITTLLLISGLSVESTLAAMGPIAFLLTTIVVFALAQKTTENPISAAIASMFFASSSYNLYRSTMALPEMYALFFQALIAYVLLNHNNSENQLIGSKEVLLAIFISSSLYIHQRSIMIALFLIIFYYLLYPIGEWIIKREARELRNGFTKVFAIGIITLSLSFPMVLLVISYYYALIQGTWISEEISIANYSLLDLQGYLWHLGLGLMVAGILGALLMIHRRAKTKKEWIVLVWGLVAFLLTIAPLFGVYAPPYRFISYLSIPMTLFAASFIAVIIGDGSFKYEGRLASISLPNIGMRISRLKTERNLPSLRQIVAALLILYTFSGFLVASRSISYWRPYTESDFVAMSWLKQQVDPNTYVLSYGGAAAVFNISNSETRTSVANAIFGAENQDDIDTVLQETYPENAIVLLLMIEGGWPPVNAAFPNAENILYQYTVVFSRHSTIIFDLTAPLNPEHIEESPEIIPPLVEKTSVRQTTVQVMSESCDVTSGCDVQKMDMEVSGQSYQSAGEGTQIFWIINNQVLNYSGSSLEDNDGMTEGLTEWESSIGSQYFISNDSKIGNHSVGIHYNWYEGYHYIFKRNISLLTSLDSFSSIKFWLYSEIDIKDHGYLSLRLNERGIPDNIYYSIVPQVGWTLYQIPIDSFNIPNENVLATDEITMLIRPVLNNPGQFDFKIDGLHFSSKCFATLEGEKGLHQIDVTQFGLLELLAVFTKDTSFENRTYLRPSSAGFETIGEYANCESSYQLWVVRYGSLS
ncbi:MAG: hypothetical protein P1Q69_16225, partial [Candidatus Thorarchaeota archaeon]|nr:hypothetical protein [Candidatus Thorarchaeota archaeon]